MRRQTHEEFIERMSVRHPEIEVLGQYANRRTKIQCRCKDCGNVWNASPSTLLFKRGLGGCPKCGLRIGQQKLKKTHEEFVAEMAKVNPSIEITSKYEKNGIYVNCRCKLDGYEWRAKPYSLRLGVGCPRCSGKEHYTTEEFKARIKKTHPDIEILGFYVNRHTKIKCRCPHGHEWETTPAVLHQGCGCPICKESRGEREVAKFLDEHNIKYLREYRFPECRNIHTLPFDFYLPDLNMCIEFDGEQHVRPNDFFGGKEAWESLQRRDAQKTAFCKANGIGLIRIPFGTPIASSQLNIDETRDSDENDF